MQNLKDSIQEVGGGRVLLTDRTGNPILTASKNGGNCYNEIVIAQESQVVPFAIVEFDADKLAPLAETYEREIPTNKKGN